MDLSFIPDRIDHIVFDTANLERSLEFYSRLPGITIATEKGRGVAKLGRQKLNIHIYPPVLSPVAASPLIGRQEYCLEADGSAESWAALLGEMAIEAVKMPGQGEKGFYIFDPDSNLIRISLTAPDKKPYITGLSGLTLLVSDLSASVRFYGQFLGMPVIKGKNETVCQLKYGCLRLVTDSPTLQKGSGDFCLIVEEDITALYSEIKDAPFVADMGIVQRTGASGPIRSFYLRDPDGNLVEISNYC